MDKMVVKVPGTKILRDTDTHPAVGDKLSAHGNIMLFAGSASQGLCGEIASHLNLPLGGWERIVFPNENIFIRLSQSVRGQDVYLIQSMVTPLHDNFMEMLIMIDVVVPYMSYTRSDKKDQPRVPITGRLIANLIEAAGANRYITIDLHAGQVQGFFNIPGDVLTAFHLLSDYIQDKNIPDLTVASADLGFSKKARNWAEKLNTPLVVVEKRRLFNTGQAEALTVIGEREHIEGRSVLLVDDEVLTGGTIVKAVEALREKGAKDIYLAFVHALLKEKAFERLAGLDLKEIITTNTIPLPADKLLPNMTVLSIAPMLGEVIQRSHLGLSVGALFNE
jgi:ribose-phosphate pyrophosphokinase